MATRCGSPIRRFLMPGKPPPPERLRVCIRPVQLEQSSRNDDEIDAQKCRKEMEALAVDEVVPERRSGNQNKYRDDPVAQPNSAWIPFESRHSRRVNDYEQRGIGTAGRIEYFEPHV